MVVASPPLWDRLGHCCCHLLQFHFILPLPHLSSTLKILPTIHLSLLTFLFKTSYHIHLSYFHPPTHTFFTIFILIIHHYYIVILIIIYPIIILYQLILNHLLIKILYNKILSSQAAVQRLLISLIGGRVVMPPSQWVGI